ncbi:orotate phosphoribosyl transferase pyrE [groundwater metagenome]
MPFADKAKLQSLIKQKALLIKDDSSFELSSGDKSNYFFDMKLVSMDPEGSELIAKSILELLKDDNVDYIGGLESGAIPIASVVANKSLQTRKRIPAFFVRKNQKERGTKKMIEGNLTENSKVVLVDDVTTKGESVLLAVRKVRELNCQVNKVITIVDRLAGAKENLAKENIELLALFTKKDFNL